MKRTTPGSHQKNSTKIGQPYICQRTKESFNSSINGKGHSKVAALSFEFKVPNDFDF